MSEVSNHTGKDRKRSKHPIKNNLYMLGLVFKISPQRVFLAFLDYLAGFASWVFSTVIFMKYFFGSADMGRSFKDVCIFLAGAMIFWLLLSAFNGWYYERYRLINDQMLYQNLNQMLFDKACNVDIACYENTEFYNSYTKASGEVFDRAVSVVDSLALMVASLLSSIYVIKEMYQINFILGLMCMLPVTGNLLLGKIENQVRYERSMDEIPYRRRQDYVNRVFYLQNYAKEIRLTGVTSIMEKTFQTAYQGIIKVVDKYSKRLYLISTAKGILCFPLVFEGTWMLGAYLAMVKKVITLADFTVLSAAIVSTTWMLIEFTDSLNRIFENALYVDNLHTFLNYEEKIPESWSGQSVPDQVEKLEFRNVSFRYSENTPFVLKNLNLVFDKDRIISLVGHNGSGKTTLVKLLMRFYDPSEGVILLNGLDIKEYCLKEYRSLIGATFQDYQIFSMSVRDNVLMGNITEGDPINSVTDALKKSGVHEKIMSLEKGESSILTREFDDDGIILSGGENQKVTIARAFAKKSSILILDEPSSALDPIAEYEMFKNYIDLCKDKNGKAKISILISHRLSSAAISDHIYMLQDGEVIESGNHKELMIKNGTYANMFRKQAETYMQEVVNYEK